MQQLLISYFYRGIIYQIINIQNRKSYIGKTSDENSIEYIENHFKNAFKKDDLKENRNGRHFYNAIRKYGRQNFKIIILGEIYGDSIEKFKQNLNEAEIACIYHFRTFGSDGEHADSIYGYNMTKGGDGWYKGHKQSQETIEKSSKSRTGKPSSLKGKTYEEMSGIQKAKERKLNSSLKMSGENHPLFNKKHKNESIQLMKEHASMKGKTWISVLGHKRDIGKGSSNPAYVHFSDNEINDIINLYTIKKYLVIDIQKIYSFNRKTIFRVLKENNITLRSRKESNQLKAYWKNKNKL
jgi:hypothetical protein